MNNEWYENEGLVSCILFFVLLAMGMIIIAFI
jgi:hypothetical protein